MDLRGGAAVIDTDGLSAQPLGLPTADPTRGDPNAAHGTSTRIAGQDRRAAGHWFMYCPGRATAANDRAVVPEPADRELVARARRGDGEAFGTLYDRHVAGIYAYVHMQVREATVAEDLTHDVFASALASLPRFQWRGDLHPWLLRLAHNRVVNYWRSAARRPEALPLPDEDGEAAVAVLADCDPADVVGVLLDVAALDLALGELSDPERDVLALRFGGGLSVGETARTLGRSAASVRSLQFRAVRRLAARLRAKDDRP
jgi:RNA polymerase sigma-70 factor, ECF subfamily